MHAVTLHADLYATYRGGFNAYMHLTPPWRQPARLAIEVCPGREHATTAEPEGCVRNKCCLGEAEVGERFHGIMVVICHCGPCHEETQMRLPSPGAAARVALLLPPKSISMDPEISDPDNSNESERATGAGARALPARGGGAPRPVGAAPPLLALLATAGLEPRRASTSSKSMLADDMSEMSNEEDMPGCFQGLPAAWGSYA